MPFSELETSFAKNEVTKFKPDVFLTLHSGVFGLFYPYGSDMKEAVRNIKNMKKVLLGVKNKFCPWCSLTTPAKYLGYVSHGNCLDYVYDILKAKYSFAWEIYTNEVNWQDYLGDKFKIRQKTKDFLKISKDNYCLKLFNPIKSEEFNFIIENFTNALFYMFEEILEIEGY